MTEKANGAPSRSRISDADHGVAPEPARTTAIDNASEINGDARTPTDALRAIFDRWTGYGWLSRYRDIAQTLDVTEEEARELVAPLKADGFVYWEAAFDDELNLIGSGFAPTVAGVNALKEAV